MTKASENKFPKVILEEVATDGSDTSNPAADHRALFLGEDGSLHLRDSSGTVSAVGGGYAPGGTDVAVADGGTGASSAATARSNLGISAANTPITDSGGYYTGTDVEAALQEIGAGGIGGGGGTGLVAVRQFAQATGSPASSLTWASAPLSGSLLVLIGQNNGSDYSGLTQTNVTWTSRRADNVGGVGNLYIWTGAVSGAGGTSLTLTGGGGGGSVYACELENTTYSSLGANGIYATTTLSNIKSTAALKGVPAGRLVCFIVHGQGAALAGPAMMSCPHSWCTVTSVGGLAFGFSTGHDITGYNETASRYYTLVDIVPV